MDNKTAEGGRVLTPLKSLSPVGDHATKCVMSGTSALVAASLALQQCVMKEHYWNSIFMATLMFGVRSIFAQDSFSIPTSSFNCSSNMICLSGAHVYQGSWDNSRIQVGRLSLVQEPSIPGTVGIAYYNQPIKFLDESTRQSASFNTSFTLDIVFGTENGAQTSGDGMAFVVSADNSDTFSDGAWFGIFDMATNGTTAFKSIVVEFDTFLNPASPFYDISYNHVSFDFRNITYAAAANASDVNVNLGAEVTVYAWVEYSYKTKLLEVRVSNSNSRPPSSLLNYTVDLFDVVDEYMWVGFSSSTGPLPANFYVGDWSFDSYGISVPGPAPSPSAPSPSASSLSAPSPSAPSPSAPSSSAPSSSAPSPSAPSPSTLTAPMTSISTGPAAMASSPSLATGSSSAPGRGKSSGSKLGIIVGIAVGVPGFLSAVGIVIVLYVWRSIHGQPELETPFVEDPMMHFRGMPMRFSYKQLSVVTGGFSEASKLGQGGFGSVFRGELPSVSGTSAAIPVAVKKISGNSTQGEKEFMTEVSVISQLRHRNLIQLLGWCTDRSKGKYLLVYELMPNGSLDKALYGPRGESHQSQTAPCLSWPQRFNIVTGMAAALDYLHQGWKQQVIHRDIKSSNVMLDEEWNAKLGDFGLARLVDHRREVATTLMAGTYGYIAPEVAASGRFTGKADVFGFGAVVLEVACGRKALSDNVPEDEMILVNWVWHQLSVGDLLSTVDKRLEDYDSSKMELMLKVGLMCSHPNPSDRPSMRHVVQVLAGDVPLPAIPDSKPFSMIGSLPVLDYRSTSQSRSGPRLSVSMDTSAEAIEGSAAAKSFGTSSHSDSNSRNSHSFS